MKGLEEDVALTLVHTADWHLGMRFRGFSEALEAELRRARLDVIDRILGAADRYGADAILCAGDLFDEPRPEEEWWKALAVKLSKVRKNPCPIFLLPGNHDPLFAGSVWDPAHPLRRALPPEVRVIDRDDFEHPLGDNAVLCAAPCRSQAGQKDLALSLPARQAGDERIRVGLVHGSTFDLKDCQVNFPIAKDAVLQRGFDYLAIGDTHGFRIVPPEAEVPTVYPGAPEPTSFGDREPGHVAIVLIRNNRKALVRKERVARWTWETCTVHSLDELRQLRSRDLTQHVLELKVEMRLSASDYQAAELLLQELQGNDAVRPRVGVLKLDVQRLELDTTNIEEFFATLPAPLQETARRLKAEERSQPELARRALYHLYQLARKVA